jgi:hypothetical protein
MFAAAFGWTGSTSVPPDALESASKQFSTAFVELSRE